MDRLRPFIEALRVLAQKSVVRALPLDKFIACHKPAIKRTPRAGTLLGLLPNRARWVAGCRGMGSRPAARL
jgi:hypothetical protein